MRLSEPVGLLREVFERLPRESGVGHRHRPRVGGCSLIPCSGEAWQAAGVS